MNIRKATKKDLKKITAIYCTEYAKQPYNEHWSEKTVHEHLTKDFKNCTTFVLAINNTVKGFLILNLRTWDHGKEGFIEELVIEKLSQGQGYGRQLLNFTENYFKKKKAKAIGLASHPQSLAFQIYKKRNYKPEEIVLMKKSL
ncbi:MAG TPA: GNAT family N-acetyltransferase [Candidatus Nanoarchaeia archaeon]|nr:GNAT family N-acetyltransferase [Candidatus Nanoarchaeia archaeon]